MKITVAFFAFIITPLLSVCQTTDKIAGEAFILIRMVNKFHVDPRPVNNKFSSDVFSGMLSKTDDDHMLFTSADIDRLGKYRAKLDDEIKHSKTAYLNLFINIYSKRLKQTDSLINEASKKPFDFYAAERFTLAEDTLYPNSIAAMQLKLYKKLKAAVLDELTDDVPGNFKSLNNAKQKRYIDSALAILTKKEISTFKRRINIILNNPDGLTKYVGNLYCETIASCFDPHTEFFPPDEKENFEGELGKQPFLFGFRINPDKNGGVIIDNLQPGSPAFKSGKLNKGDKFISIQWEDTPAVDVSDMTTHEFGELLDESNHKPVLFTVKKSGGAMVQVTLQKEQIADDDDGKVKSFILKGASNIGYIYLPAFYQDWEAKDEGLNGCANDVGREILKLKKENISALIMDVRYNGGGSVSEATELAGIFIGAGPMAQEKGQDGKVHAIKSVDNGTLYDGPLAVLVNGYSASASEIFAAALQDYNRAVVIGAPTFGKATMQVVLPMDTTVTRDDFTQTKTENYLKVTVGKLFRVNGATAQFIGVQPDIILPDVLDAYSTKESDEPFALKPTVTNANKYYIPFSPLPVKTLMQSVQTEIDTNSYFNTVKRLITESKKQKATKDISLNVKDVLAAIDLTDKNDDNFLRGKPSKKFIVQNNQYEMTRLQSNDTLKELNDEFIHQIAADTDVSIAYDVLSQLKTK